MVSPLQPMVSCIFSNLPVLCLQANAEYTFREVFSLNKKMLYFSLGLLTAFILWTAAVIVLDVQAIGPEGSSVGFAGLNGFVHQLTGVHLGLYILTDWLSLVPLIFGMGFAILGLTQWIRRGCLWKVDPSILILGIFYLITGALFLFFEKWIINYRPVLINGILEASYPSSTTMLVICVMSTACMQLQARIGNLHLRKWTSILITLFTVLMILGRLLSGVHWVTDIIGGILLSSGLVVLYRALTQKRDC